MQELNEFIKEHLSQNSISMVGHIQNKQLLPRILDYIRTPDEHSPESILTLKVKLFDYYSCTRDFSMCDHIWSLIKFQLNSTTFQNDKIKAQYLISVGYQYRNYEPTRNFRLGEKSFQESEALTLNLIGEPKTSETEKQECIDLLFGAMISRFWLYAHYSNEMQKAENMLPELQKIRDETFPAYRLAYSFFVGSYYVKIENYENAIETLEKAKDEQPCDETAWFFNRLLPSIAEQLKESKEKRENTYSKNPNKLFSFLKSRSEYIICGGLRPLI